MKQNNLHGVDWYWQLDDWDCKQGTGCLLMWPCNKLIGEVLNGETNEVGSVADVLAVVNTSAEAVVA